MRLEVLKQLSQLGILVFCVINLLFGGGKLLVFDKQLLFEVGGFFMLIFALLLFVRRAWNAII